MDKSAGDLQLLRFCFVCERTLTDSGLLWGEMGMKIDQRGQLVRVMKGGGERWKTYSGVLHQLST